MIWPHAPYGEEVTSVWKIPGNVKEEAVEFAEEHLQCGPFELAWVRDQGKHYFATRNPEDYENFSGGHALAGKSRYRWVDIGEGVKLGWLIDA